MKMEGETAVMQSQTKGCLEPLSLEETRKESSQNLQREHNLALNLDFWPPEL